jgi:FMN phosphatase YigB (HAD superfamily)
MNEQSYILTAFEKTLARFSGKRIAIYGVGQNTKYILDNVLDRSAIVCLADAQRAGDIIYGYRVCHAEELLGKADVVIVVARVAVLHLIHKRIKWLTDHEIVLCDIKGDNLNEICGVSLMPDGDNPYWSCTLQQLKSKIDKHDVISFDIFETLLMRKVVFPQDVFRIAEREYYDAFGKEVDFAKSRAEAERRLNDIFPASIEEIYAEMRLSEDEKRWFQKRELEIERRVLTGREDIVDCLNYALKQNKAVFLLSDMYYSSETLDSLLFENNIYDYKEIIVSCEYGKTKETGELFDVLLTKSGWGGVETKTVLHIGDNRHADIEMAQAQGIDSYYVMNSYDMLLNSALYELLVDVTDLDDSILVGEFASKILNSPFALCKNRGKVGIDTLDAAVCFFMPMIKCFMQYLYAHMQGKNRGSQLIFLARDGYLIKILYDCIREEFALNIPECQYILCSRTSLSDEYANYHNNYLQYLKDRGVLSASRIVAYDFVTKGTQLSKLERICNRKIDLICFASFNIDSAGIRGEVHSMLGNHNYYNLRLNFLKYYELLEILSAPKQTQFLYFDDKIMPIFADAGSEYGKKWNQIALAQKKVMQAITQLKRIDPLWYTRNPRIVKADKIFGLINSKYAMVSDEVKTAFVFESHSENVKPTQWWDRVVP